MRYRFLLQFLKILIYIKRFFWWLGRGVYFVLAKIGTFFAKIVIYIKLHFIMLLKRLGIIGGSGWLLKRDILQILFFIVLFCTILNQTKLVPKADLSFIGQKTVAYGIVGGEQDIQTEEVASASPRPAVQNYSWKTGSITVEESSGRTASDADQDLGTEMAGGSALSKPILMPGTTSAGGSAIAAVRNQVTNYVVVSGDSLSTIASDFGVTVATILWENNLTERSIIRPGDLLKIPPVSGIMHTVAKGDTIAKIAKQYGVKPGDIIAFNNLKTDGSDLVKGARIMIPNGKRTEVAAAPNKPGRTVASTTGRKAAPPNSSATPGVSGYVWPSSSHIVTQYFGFTHHALDIAGPWQSPIYATKSGTVIKSQCGWNSGYGCYVIIDHGGGIKSLYGHNSQLLVSVGDEVETGQTIALMGNTGHVRGVTGIHSHFEIQVNGARVNPLNYVR